MKKVILTIAMTAVIMLTAKAQSHTHTVSNDGSGGAQFTTFQAAMDASTNGDTILIEGTNINYSVANLTKQLVIIGMGFNPNKSNPRRAKLGSNQFQLHTVANGSTFYGVEFTSTVIFFEGIANMDFEDCLFDLAFDCGNQPANNFVFRNCIFLSSEQDVNFSTNSANNNILFVSCVFNGRLEFNTNSAHSVTIDHCLFFGDNFHCLSSARGQVIQNSIFMNTTDLTIGINTADEHFNRNNTFTNNIGRLSIDPNPAGNTSSGNLHDVDPLFVSTGTSTYSFSSNYHLQLNSPAINAASDGSDIGPHGSTSHFSETGEVLITPIIRSLNINNTSVAPNGNLNVTIHATTPTDH